jgi:hypothetical protein
MERKQKLIKLGSVIIYLLIFVFGIVAIYNAGNAFGKWLFRVIN